MIFRKLHKERQKHSLGPNSAGTLRSESETQRKPEVPASPRHFDMYRLASSDDLWDIGWEDYLERGGVCAVEWSENVEDALENAISVTIEKLGEESRRITIEGGESLADLSL